MSTAKRLAMSATGILLVASIVLAQEQNRDAGNRTTITVTAAATADRVRFTAPSSVVQMHLEVYTETGAKQVDLELKGGNILDWPLRSGQAQGLDDGAYVCVVTLKGLSGKLTQKVGAVKIAGKRVTVEPAQAAQLNTQQAQAIGPMEEDSTITVLTEGEPAAATVIAHNGEEGQSFRMGDFFSGKDRELMRLTEEGNLGIGTASPQARLDVAGMIRTQGLILPDGSILTSALGGLPDGGSELKGTIDTLGKRKKGGQVNAEVFGPISGDGTVNTIPKFTGANTIGNSALTEVSGSVGIGTANPQGQLHIFGTATADVFAGMGPDLINGPAFNYGYAGSSFGRGAGFFNVRPDGSAVAPNPSLRFATANQQRMIITNLGNVGIGTTNPGAALDVVGVVNTGSQYNIFGNRVLSIPGTNNIFAGAGAGTSNTMGSANSFFGTFAGSFNTTGAQNSFFGNQAGFNNTSGSNNSFFGFSAGLSNTAGENSFFGSAAGQSNTTGPANSFFGNQAGQNNTTAGFNAFFGNQAGHANISGNGNSFFGNAAGQANTTGASNSFFGARAGQSNMDGGFNSFFGVESGNDNTTGNSNSFFGAQAGFSNTDGGSNSFFGIGAGFSNTSGSSNSFFGTNAGQLNATGVSNSFFGILAGNANTTGNGNTFIGDSSGEANTTGENNTLIGFKTCGPVDITNATAVGAQAYVTQSNSLVLGSIFGVNGASANVDVGIGISEPKAQLHVQGGNIYVGQGGQGIILKSPDGSQCRLLTIDNSGGIVLTAITCP